MDNFDLKKYLAEGKLNENMFDAATTGKIAQSVADAFSADDDLDLKYVVNPRIEAGSFDLDVEAGPNTPGPEWKDKNGFGIDNYLGDLAGGSFYIKDGVVYNAASRNAPVANVTPEGEVKMISAADSRAAIGMDDEIDMDRYNDELDMKDGEKTDYMERRREMSDYIEEGEEEKENKPSNKMKKSELKEMIRAAMLAETSVFEVEEEEVDVETEETEDVETEEGGEEEGGIEVDQEAEAGLTGDKKTVQDNLEAALEGARALGDDKLADQIGNSITFFTRTHVVGQDQVAETQLNESVNRMKKLAGLIK